MTQWREVSSKQRMCQHEIRGEKFILLGFDKEVERPAHKYELWPGISKNIPNVVFGDPNHKSRGISDETTNP
jgi:hypothetical protein